MFSFLTRYFVEKRKLKEQKKELHKSVAEFNKQASKAQKINDTVSYRILLATGKKK